MSHLASPGGAPTILVADREAEPRDRLRRILRRAGYRAIAAGSHAEALALLRAFRFALILADAELPADPADGQAPFDRLRAAAGDTPIIICTTHPPAAIADLATHAPDGVLPRPCDPDALLDAVRHTLATARSRVAGDTQRTVR